jgi:hypothetical protein
MAIMIYIVGTKCVFEHSESLVDEVLIGDEPRLAWRRVDKGTRYKMEDLH